MIRVRSVLFVLAVSALAAPAQESNAALSNPYSSDADIAAGEKMFTAQCASCHGRDGRGGAGGPDLSTGRFKRASSDEGLFQIVNRGIPGTTMPGSSFNAGQVWRLVAFVRSLSGARRLAVTGADPARGGTLYAKHNCGGCHQGGAGAAPDLMLIAPNRSLNELKQSILEPSADVHSAFWRVTVTPKAGGAAVTGARLNEDTFTVQLRERGGRLRSFAKEDLANMAVDRSSPMPSFQGKLSDAEITDLVAYLISRGGAR